jgi:hypothetical protein
MLEDISTTVWAFVWLNLEVTLNNLFERFYLFIVDFWNSILHNKRRKWQISHERKCCERGASRVKQYASVRMLLSIELCTIFFLRTLMNCPNFCKNQMKLLFRTCAAKYFAAHVRKSMVTVLTANWQFASSYILFHTCTDKHFSIHVRKYFCTWVKLNVF